VGLERMLRMYLIANWFNLADEACEDALYDIAAFREFCRIDLGRERVPDATTLLRFRHLLEQHNIGAALFAKVGELLQANGLKLSGGTIVDAAIIAAPSSTKNQDKARDPEIHQTKKGNQWYFGMKVHIGVDSKSGLVHSASVTPANVHDEVPLAMLVDKITTKPLAEVAKAIEEEDSARFSKAFDGLTTACNACHQAAKHAYIVIRRPDISTFGNQEFAVKKK
jgi:IS5 family transposase